MRKNRMMRAASALLVAVLLTTSTISGTFAKYVTTAEGSDSARVAKWGVEVGVVGSLFENSYINAPDDSADATVISVNDEDVVAPGTKNETGLTFKITGQPEVETKVEIKVGTVDGGVFTDGTAKDVVIPADTYTDYTKVIGYEQTGGKDDITKPVYGTFILADDYHPLRFTLKQNGAEVAGCVDVDISVIEDYLEGATVSKPYDPNTVLDDVLGTYTLTWSWAYGEFDGIQPNDRADTLLGQVAAGKLVNDDIITGVNIAIQITVTQVD